MRSILVAIGPLFFDVGAGVSHAWLRGMLSATTYYCDAKASGQKGGIEIANGCIRRWLPRNTDLDALDDDDIQEIAMTLNQTPRKCLQFRSLVEAFLAELGEDADIRSNAAWPHRCGRADCQANTISGQARKSRKADAWHPGSGYRGRQHDLRKDQA